MSDDRTEDTCDCKDETKWWLGEHRPARRAPTVRRKVARPACPKWSPYVQPNPIKRAERRRKEEAS